MDPPTVVLPGPAPAPSPLRAELMSARGGGEEREAKEAEGVAEGDLELHPACERAKSW